MAKTSARPSAQPKMTEIILSAEDVIPVKGSSSAVELFARTWPPAPFDKHAPIINSMLEFVSPESKEDCRQELANVVALLKVILSMPAPTRALKAKVQKLVKALRLSATLWSELYGWVPGEDGHQALNKLAENLEKRLPHMRVRRTGRNVDPVKKRAAGAAYRLLEKYGTSRPTLTAGGPFFELSNLLYEAATGKRAELDHQCEIIFRDVRHGPISRSEFIKKRRRGL
jgi:hypothetical protein